MKYIFSTEYIEYLEALGTMEQYVDDILKNKINENITWMLEHQHVYTGGTSSTESEIIEKTSIPIVKTNRGGKYIYHGPGQRVVYLIIRLQHIGIKNIKAYINLLGQIMIDTLYAFGIKSEMKPEMIGIWVKSQSQIEKKIGAIGIRIRKGIAFHGIALNIKPDLNYYSKIIPCGIKKYGITSMKEIGIKTTMAEVDSEILSSIKKRIGN